MLLYLTTLEPSRASDIETGSDSEGTLNQLRTLASNKAIIGDCLGSVLLATPRAEASETGGGGFSRERG